MGKQETTKWTDFNGEVFALDRLHLTTKWGEGGLGGETSAHDRGALSLAGGEGRSKSPAAAPTGPTNTDRLLPRFYFHIILISKGLPGRISISPGIKDECEKEGEEDEEVGGGASEGWWERRRRGRIETFYLNTLFWGHVTVNREEKAECSESESHVNVDARLARLAS